MSRVDAYCMVEYDWVENVKVGFRDSYRSGDVEPPIGGEFVHILFQD